MLRRENSNPGQGIGEQEARHAMKRLSTLRPFAQVM
jgi:hypothetical protein